MENLGELFAAMALARLEFGTFAKSKVANMGTYTYSYADLSDIIDATAPALAKHGLVIIQEPEVTNEAGKHAVVISGCIAHKSGGVYSFRSLPLPVVGNTAQAIGSAISYARRYQLSAILNLAASDDDGQAAQESAQNAPKSSQKGKTPSASGKAQDNPFEEPTPTPALATPEQVKTLNALGLEFYGKAEWEEQLPKIVEAVSTGAALKAEDLKPREAEKLIEGIKKRMAQVAQMKAAA